MITSAYPATNADFFRDVIGEFIPHGGRILDANTGHKRIWAKLINQTALSETGYVQLYDPVFIDIRVLPGVDAIMDDRYLFFANGIFDGVIFDPPYACGAQPGHVRSGSFETVEKEITSMYKFKDFRRLITDVRTEFHRVLKPRGILIMKSGEFREKGEVFPTTAYAWTKWKELFKLEALLVQVIPASGIVGQKPIHTHVRTAHNTWSVWRPKHPN